MSEKFTPGPWRLEIGNGWGNDTTGVYAPDSKRPMFVAVKPKEYYTDYPERTDADGEVWIVCSKEAAEKAGNHVATEEVKERIRETEQANAHLIAAAPDMYEALADIVDAHEGLPGFGPAKAALAKARGEL